MSEGNTNFNTESDINSSTAESEVSDSSVHQYCLEVLMWSYTGEAIIIVSRNGTEVAAHCFPQNPTQEDLYQKYVHLGWRQLKS